MAPLILACYCCCMLTIKGVAGEPVGVNWGWMAQQRILPSMIIDMLMANHVPRVKLFSINPFVLDGFNQSGIELMVAVPNNVLNVYLSHENCTKLIREKILPHHEPSRIRYIAIGNEPFSKNSYADVDKREDAIPAMQNFQKAIDGLGLRFKINMTIPHFTDVLTNLTKPSECEFESTVKGPITETLELLRNNGGFFSIDVNLVYLVNTMSLDPEFALFDGTSKTVVKDGNITYTNLFDLVYDSFVWALTKVGFGDVEIVVAQIGWPTDGYPYATIGNAKRFYGGFLPRMRNNTGTPLRPNFPIRSYAYSLIDENRLPMVRGTFQRHSGIYKYDGRPKFPIDLRGAGVVEWPLMPRGIVYLPERWCVFNGDWSNRSRVLEQYEMACSISDCSSTMYGGSCNNLSEEGNVSYGFNMYYQSKSQATYDQACNFDGLGKLVTENASTGTCLFPIQILVNLDDGIGSSGRILSGSFMDRALSFLATALSLAVALALVLLLSSILF